MNPAVELEETVILCLLFMNRAWVYEHEIFVMNEIGRIKLDVYWSSRKERAA